MAMWARRCIQRCLEENSSFGSPSTLHDWVQRLNTISDDYVATEWEVGLLNAFAKVGVVEHEPALGKKLIDLVFTSSDGKLSFGADIATISDQQWHRENPVEAFSEELSRRAKKAIFELEGFPFTSEKNDSRLTGAAEISHRSFCPVLLISPPTSSTQLGRISFSG